jgi:hypothetical protein
MKCARQKHPVWLNFPQVKKVENKNSRKREQKARCNSLLGFRKIMKITSSALGS